MTIDIIVLCFIIFIVGFLLGRKPTDNIDCSNRISYSPKPPTVPPTVPAPLPTSRPKTRCNPPVPPAPLPTERHIV